MGIERSPESVSLVPQFLSCKKSPQTWGLKALPELIVSDFTTHLQKESPDMGIESRGI